MNSQRALLKVPTKMIDPVATGIFETEDDCRAMLERLRWPRRVVCPRCQAKRTATVASRYQYQCRACGFRFSVTTRTLMHGTHLPLQTWCRALYVMLESPRRVSANKLAHVLGLRYKTAWFLCRRIRAALAGSEEDSPNPCTIGREQAIHLLSRYNINPYHPGSNKYLDGYLDEVCFRFNHRNDPNRFCRALKRLVSPEYR